LRDRFALLTTGRRTALPRHQTLRATLDWSYQLLTGAERELLHRLAIFVGPFSLEAACAVVAEEGVTASDIAGGVADLIGKSLVFKTASVVTAEFRLLETTRAYALDRLGESGAHGKVAARHAEYLREVLRDMEDQQRAPPQDEDVAALHRRADEIRAALDWAFSASGDTALGVELTIAAAPLWFELSQMAVAHSRVEQALRHGEPGSAQEMWLLLALGHAHWYVKPGSDAMEPAFARALAIAERIGATAVRTRALWGMWAVRRARGDYRAALEIARRYADGATGAGDVGAMHLADRILGLTHHLIGDQPAAREATERALRRPHPLSPRSDIGYQVETPVAMRAQLARILWLMGFPDQAMAAVREAVQNALNGGRSFPVCYAVGLAGLPVAVWVNAVDEARRLLDLLAAHSDGNERWEQWRICYTRVLRLRAGDAAEALVAAYIEATSNFIVVPPFADRPLDATIPVPLPGAEPIDVEWSTPEVLRVQAELLLWHDAPGAAATAEARLLRALEIARSQ
jgi:tetratricopeptide (TPR) repeat protein